MATTFSSSPFTASFSSLASSGVPAAFAVGVPERRLDEPDIAEHPTAGVENGLAGLAIAFIHPSIHASRYTREEHG